MATYSVELQLLRDSPLNSVLVLDGAPLYTIKSEPRFIPRKTIVYKAHRDTVAEPGTPIATIEWPRWGKIASKALVQMGEQKRPWDEILNPTSQGRLYPL